MKIAVAETSFLHCEIVQERLFKAALGDLFTGGEIAAAECRVLFGRREMTVTEIGTGKRWTITRSRPAHIEVEHLRNGIGTTGNAQVARRMENGYTLSMASCFSCGADLAPAGKIYRNTLCPKCGADARVCLNCEFYAPGAHWDCRETIEEAVRQKDRANFCDYFRASTRRHGGKPGREDAGAAEGRPEPDENASARSGFDKLFGNG